MARASLSNIMTSFKSIHYKLLILRTICFKVYFLNVCNFTKSPEEKIDIHELHIKDDTGLPVLDHSLSASKSPSSCRDALSSSCTCKSN